MSRVKLSPSILSADFGKLNEQVKEAEEAGADYIHIDIMDGQFVPAISYGTAVTAAVKRSTKLPLDAHLMVMQPERYITDFSKIGVSIITVHIETCPHIHRVIQLIKEAGVKAGVAINPGTPLSSIEEVLPYLDLVLVMTVNPGASGQTFIQSQLDKISRVRKELDKRKLTAELEVDGGVNTETAPKAVAAGATILVAGAAIFHPGETIKSAIDKLKASYEKAV
ncbi:MAG: ribulose-phosphate 3-epimerase [Chloroflexota bacterium]